jgi:hypothetical protein
MKIRLLLNIGTNETEYPHLKEGEHEVLREVGMKLIQRGWAVSLEPQVHAVKAVPTQPSIHAAVEQATEDVKTYRAKQTRATEMQSANKEQ